jgi:uncharacterized damage-inducible protein DinB
VAHEQLNGTWSIAQNVGHLADVEDLWLERLEDLKQGRATYTPGGARTLPSRRDPAPGRMLTAIVAELTDRRWRLVEAFSSAPPALQLSSALHERLQCSMRLVDCAQFCCEHDDHHLLRIRTLRTAFGLGTG